MQITITTEAIEAEAAEYQRQSDAMVTRANALSGAAQGLRAFNQKQIEAAQAAAQAAQAVADAAAAAIVTPEVPAATV